jgi:hypothetical protein
VRRVLRGRGLGEVPNGPGLHLEGARGALRMDDEVLRSGREFSGCGSGIAGRHGTLLDRGKSGGED